MYDIICVVMFICKTLGPNYWSYYSKPIDSPAFCWLLACFSQVFESFIIRHGMAMVVAFPRSVFTHRLDLFYLGPLDLGLFINLEKRCCKLDFIKLNVFNGKCIPFFISLCCDSNLVAPQWHVCFRWTRFWGCYRLVSEPRL